MSEENPFNRHHSGDQGPPSFDPDLTQIIPPSAGPDKEETSEEVRAPEVKPALRPDPVELDPDPVLPPTPRVVLTAEPEVVSGKSSAPQWLPWLAVGLASVALLVALFYGNGSGPVSPSQIEDGSITGVKLAPGSIEPGALADSSLAELQGPTGPTGKSGKDGARVVGGLSIRAEETASLPAATANRSGVAECESQEQLVGGGANVTGGDDVFINTSGPIIDDQGQASGWRATAESLSINNKEWILTVVALCAEVEQ